MGVWGWGERGAPQAAAPIPLCAVNAAGETALDVARRLKHSECEELVGGDGDGVG